MSLLLQLILNGILVGAIYAVASAGYALTFSLNLNNFSYGSTMMLGGYVSYVVLPRLHCSVLANVLVLVLIGLLAGSLTYWGAVKPFIKTKFSVIPATLALSVITGNVVFMLQGSDSFSIRKYFSAPKIISAHGVVMTDTRLCLLIAALSIVVIIGLILRYTNLGLKLRAYADDETAALTMGISTKNILWYSCMISCVAGVLAGFLIAFDFDLEPFSGTGLLIKVYTATVIGGAYYLTRVAVAAILIGVIENLVAGYLASEYSLASVFIFLTLILLFKKQGLGKQGLIRAV